jgi:hypothetical protein
MKRLKNFVKLLSISALLTATTALAILGLISIRVKSQLLSYKIPKKEDIVDSTIIHFTHGSTSRENCIYQKKRLGGYLGGHIEIEVNNKVYGFLFDSLPISFISQTTFNSKFEFREKSDWLNYSQYDKITSIVIPITMNQKTDLLNILNSYLKKEPYDYAFIGQRCASATAETLSDAKILNEFSNKEAIIAFFYPRTLRFTLLQFAKKNNLKIYSKPGINCHNWE